MAVKKKATKKKVAKKKTTKKKVLAKVAAKKAPKGGSAIVRRVVRKKAPTRRATTQQLKKSALKGYLEFGTITAGCLGANINRCTWYKWIKTDPEFETKVENAKEEVTDGLEQVAITRAKGGSDTLLIFLLKGNRPDKYKERTLNEIDPSEKFLDFLSEIAPTLGPPSERNR